jgi:hypothetical protein
LKEDASAKIAILKLKGNVNNAQLDINMMHNWKSVTVFVINMKFIIKGIAYVKKVIKK